MIGKSACKNKRNADFLYIFAGKSQNKNIIKKRVNKYEVKRNEKRLNQKGPHKWMQRSLLKTAGFTQSEIERPLIGVVGSWTDIFPGHMHLDKLAKAVA